jgi:hypothetical protein
VSTMNWENGKSKCIGIAEVKGDYGYNVRVVRCIYLLFSVSSHFFASTPDIEAFLACIVTVQRLNY